MSGNKRKAKPAPVPTITCVGVVEVPGGWRRCTVEVPATMKADLGKVQSKGFAVADAVFALEGTVL